PLPIRRLPVIDSHKSDCSSSGSENIQREGLNILSQTNKPRQDTKELHSCKSSTQFYKSVQNKYHRNELVNYPTENSNSQSEHSQFDVVMNALADMQKQLHNLVQKENVPTNITSVHLRDIDEREEERQENEKDIEIGRIGSGVIIKKYHWYEACAKPTQTSMATYLVDVIFQIETLLVSNLRGGKCKIKSENEQEQKQALDKNIMQAIYYSVEKQHKSKFDKAKVGSAINNHLTYLRKQKGKNDELEKELERIEKDKQ
ncbi:PREDICTED: uncharacterized protein LOC105562997, partial [Vollenhovia emeryi]|uniref:uncharacterized protein LOC105562997 n=1 Tax=Vollenhovia emeryi TaxID=411798 RepID=UPI0005F39968